MKNNKRTELLKIYRWIKNKRYREKFSYYHKKISIQWNYVNFGTFIIILIAVDTIIGLPRCGTIVFKKNTQCLLIGEVDVIYAGSWYLQFLYFLVPMVVIPWILQVFCFPSIFLPITYFELQFAWCWIKLNHCWYHYNYNIKQYFQNIRLLEFVYTQWYQ